MSVAFVDGCKGFGLGYQYALANGKVEEVMQGKNVYLALPYQSGEIACLCALVEKVAAFFFHGVGKWSMSIFSNIAPLLWLPLGTLLASIKNQDYTKLVEYFPNTLGRILPRELSKRTTRVLSFITDHLSSCIKVAMFVGVVALAYLGCHAFSCVFVGSWLYHEIDIRGYLPRKVSLFSETYLPLVANACLIFCGGSLFLRVVGAITLASTFPYMNQFLTHKIDGLVRYFLSIKSTTLAEYEAPLLEKNDLSYAEINAILDGDNEDYQVDPAHCSKFIVDSFPKDYGFDRFLQIFNQIQWSESLVASKLKEDDRFLDFLREKYPEADLKKQWENLANKSEFLIDWMRGELSQLVGALKGEIRPQGEQKDLAVGIENCAMILAYLQRPSLSQIEREDVLLKLAVEAGGYCARGIKRASGEIVDERIIPSELESDEANPQKSYERKLKQALQNKRRGLVQNYYNFLIENIKLPSAVSQDVHSFDIYRTYLSLGFYPLTPRERDRISLFEIATWNMYAPIQKEMMRQYRDSFDDIISENEVLFSQYLRQYIYSNNSLSEVEKESLIDKWINRNDDQWGIEETIQKFHRIILVKLGILRRATC